MLEAMRFINVCCETPTYNLKYFNYVFAQGELVVVSSDMTSTKDALIALLTQRTLPTAGRIDWNVAPSQPCLITYNEQFLYKDLSVAENFTLTKASPQMRLYSQRQGIQETETFLRKYDVYYDANKPVYSLTKMQQYILCALKAVYLGAQYLILSDVVQLNYASDLAVLQHIVKKLLQEGISVFLTDCYENPLFSCATAQTILRFEGGSLVQVFKSQEDFYAYENYHQFIQNTPPAHGGDSALPWNSGSPIAINISQQRHIRKLALTLYPGQITYLVGHGLYEYDFIDALFDTVPRYTLTMGREVYQDMPIERLVKVGVGYFPQNVDALIFPHLDYTQNTTMLVLKRISYWGLVIRNTLEKYMLAKTVREYPLCRNTPFYTANYENRVITAANRFVLNNWKLVVVHLPNINRLSLEAKVLQSMIYKLSHSGASVLVLTATKNELLTRVDARVEFDKHGVCENVQ